MSVCLSVCHRMLKITSEQIFAIGWIQQQTMVRSYVQNRSGTQKRKSLYGLMETDTRIRPYSRKQVRGDDEITIIPRAEKWLLHVRSLG